MGDPRVWLVTGATSGFGRAIVDAALAAGDVVIVEPGAFRTGFNQGGALGTSEPIAAYRDQLDALKATFAEQDGKQPGDPAKAAGAILAALDADQPPLRLVLGEDAVDAITASLDGQRAELESWATLGRDTAFATIA